MTTVCTAKQLWLLIGLAVQGTRPSSNTDCQARISPVRNCVVRTEVTISVEYVPTLN